MRLPQLVLETPGGPGYSLTELIYLEDVLKPSSKRRDVEQDVLERVEADRLRLSKHAEVRMLKRGVLLPEVVEVLSHGIHNPEQDQWDEEHEAWNYAIEGETVDTRWLRVAVAFVEQDDLLVITVITLHE